MANKDYKNSVHPDSKPAKKPFPGWAWLITGVLAGLFVAFLWYLQQLPSKESPLSLQQTVKKEIKKVEKKIEAAVEDNSLSSRFDFYKLLPDMEVVVPNNTLLEKEQVLESQDGKGAAANYFLQAASFRQYADADRMRANLALMGVESHIQKITLKAGSTWHRVRIGPFKSKRKMDVIRSRLQKTGIQPVVVKEQG